MNEENVPVVTSVDMPGKGSPGLREPIIISAEENATEISIRDDMLAEPGLGGVDLHIEIRNNDLIISGSIASEEQRALALDIVGRFVPGSRIVDEMALEDSSGFFCEV